MAIEVKGYAQNSREATEINLSDWLGIQQGSSLEHMKKVSWKTLLDATKDYYSYEQIASSAHWQIVHNLGKYPSVTVIDSGGTLVMGDINYISENELTLDFSVEFSGRAFLN